MSFLSVSSKYGLLTHAADATTVSAITPVHSKSLKNNVVPGGSHLFGVLEPDEKLYLYSPTAPSGNLKKSFTFDENTLGGGAVKHFYFSPLQTFLVTASTVPDGKGLLCCWWALVRSPKSGDIVFPQLLDSLPMPKYSAAQFPVWKFTAGEEYCVRRDGGAGLFVYDLRALGLLARYARKRAKETLPEEYRKLLAEGAEGGREADLSIPDQELFADSLFKEKYLMNCGKIKGKFAFFELSNAGSGLIPSLSTTSGADIIDGTSNAAAHNSTLLAEEKKILRNDAADLAFSQQYFVATFQPEAKGQPARVTLYNLAEPDSKVNEKAFYNAQSCMILWNFVGGPCCLVLSHNDEDKSGESYYGVTTCFWMAASVGEPSVNLGEVQVGTAGRGGRDLGEPHV